MGLDWRRVKVALLLLTIQLAISFLVVAPSLAESLPGPTPEAWREGERLAYRVAVKLRQEKGGYPSRLAALVWGREETGQEGPMVSFVLALLGVRPRFDERGMVTGLELMDPGKLGRPRLDVVAVTTGSFRDLFRGELLLLDRAYRLALAASYESILAAYPELQEELDTALSSLGTEGFKYRGKEPLEQNYVARNWIMTVQRAVAGGRQPREAAEEAIMRIFAPPPGEKGFVPTAKVREERAREFLERLGYAYTATAWGKREHMLFKELLEDCNVVVHSHARAPVLDQNGHPLEETYFAGLVAALEVWGSGMIEKFTDMGPRVDDKDLSVLSSEGKVKQNQGKGEKEPAGQRSPVRLAPVGKQPSPAPSSNSSQPPGEAARHASGFETSSPVEPEPASRIFEVEIARSASFEGPLNEVKGARVFLLAFLLVLAGGFKEFLFGAT